MEYPEKSLKWDPETGDVAVRTRLPADGKFASMAWLVAPSAGGARNASPVEVDDWIDIPVVLLQALAEQAAEAST